MRPAARAAFRPVSERLEGRTRWPYADVKGLVTVSVGCLIEPFHLALPLSWMIGDRRATEAEIRADWNIINGLPAKWGTKPWTAKRQEPLTKIRLTDEGVDRLMASRLDLNVSYLRTKLFPEWDEYSADAQLAMVLTAWAIGAGFDKTKPPRSALVAAIRERRWIDAKVHAHLSETSNAGVVDRNRAIERCFDNAATVEEHGLEPDVLHWPAIVIPPVTITGDSEPNA
jgi:hypothetical protein